ncbi:hypothetical protein [Arthrobacter sp. SD76]|uniref:hypothetical protein n=1 Tax=Arthrobacter sp. SD76 TaxID=3415007 RepID=UPI003C708164
MRHRPRQGDHPRQTRSAAAARLRAKEPALLPGRDKQDLAVLHRLRAAGLLHPDVTGYHASPGDEPLLWAPDLVAWSFRRDLALGDSQWFTPYETVATVLHARTGLAVKEATPICRSQVRGSSQRPAPYRAGNQLLLRPQV